LELVVGERENHTNFVDLYEELEALKERKLLEEMVEQQLNNVVVEEECVVEW
jgi:hypothetical protein